HRNARLGQVAAAVGNAPAYGDQRGTVRGAECAEQQMVFARRGALRTRIARTLLSGLFHGVRVPVRLRSRRTSARILARLRGRKAAQRTWTARAGAGYHRWLFPRRNVPWTCTAAFARWRRRSTKAARSTMAHSSAWSMR